MLDTTLIVSAIAELTQAQDLGGAEAPLNLTERIKLASGVGADQADKVFHDKRTIAASATDSLDLAGGGLLDPLNQAFTVAKVKAVIVRAAKSNVNNVHVTRPAANGVPLFLAAGDGIPVPPGGVFVWIAPGLAGAPVTGGSADLVDIVNGGGGSQVVYDIVIFGTSA